MKLSDVENHIVNEFEIYCKALEKLGQLLKGTKTVKIANRDCIVTGWLKDGILIGKGELVNYSGEKYQAWFYNDIQHGMVHGQLKDGDSISLVVYEGNAHGPATFYSTSGIHNIVHENAWEISSEEVQADAAYFSKEGVRSKVPFKF